MSAPATTSTDATTSAAARRGAPGASFLVAAGILLSRIVGLVRERVFAHYFGTSVAGDAFKAALKIPNVLQALFGEGALSASFIPVYAGLLAKEEKEEARRVAGAVLATLALLVSVLVLVFVLITPWIIAVIAPGFDGAKRDLTITLVRILWPSAGLFVLGAWCLGVLNSHRRFFLSYASPVVWSAAMIVVLLAWGGRRPLGELAVLVAWGSVAGAGLAFLVQLPVVLKLVPGLRPHLDTSSDALRTVGRNFVPAFVARGVNQISGYIDQVLASFLIDGSVSVLSYATLLYTLPVSLFGMSVSAAELPAMSGGASGEGAEAFLRTRISGGLRRIAYLVVPSAMAFLALGDVIAGTVFQGGNFQAADARWVWSVLAGSAVGLLAGTLSRLYSSAYYALRDTRSPLRFALVRVVLTTVLGWLLAIWLPRAAGIDGRWAAAGLSSSAGIAAWVEFALLRRSMAARIGPTPLGRGYVFTLWGAAAAAAALAWGLRYVVDEARHPLLAGGLILGAYGLAYLAVTTLFRLPEATAFTGRLTRRLRR